MYERSTRFERRRLKRTVVVTGHHLEQRLRIVGPATLEQARECAEAMGQPLENLREGEYFYEVEVLDPLPVGSMN